MTSPRAHDLAAHAAAAVERVRVLDMSGVLAAVERAAAPMRRLAQEAERAAAPLALAAGEASRAAEKLEYAEHRATNRARGPLHRAPARVARRALRYLLGMPAHLSLAAVNVRRALLLAWDDETSSGMSGAQPAPAELTTNETHRRDLSDHQSDTAPAHPRTTVRTLVAAPGAPTRTGPAAAA